MRQYILLIITAIVCITRGTRLECTVISEASKWSLSCKCSSVYDGYRTESMSELLLSELQRLKVQSLEKLCIEDCNLEKVRIDVDLSTLERRGFTFSEICFENISNLLLRFISLPARISRLVFTDINNLHLTGTIPSIGYAQDELRIFFRTNRQSNILMDNLQVYRRVDLINFQDVSKLTVYRTSFSNLNEVDFFHVGGCYDTIEQSSPIQCSTQLFSSFSQSTFYPVTGSTPYYPRPVSSSTPYYPPSYRPTYYTPVSTQSTQDYTNRPQTSTARPPYTLRPIQSTTNGTPLPYSSTVTSNPIFIVCIILLTAVILIAVPVILYIRHQNRGGSWRVGWTSDNWFMRPTTASPTNTSQSQARSMRQRYDTPENRRSERTEGRSRNVGGNEEDQDSNSINSLEFAQVHQTGRRGSTSTEHI